jgi:GNAT superfamily N-acetyltransferase
MSDPLVIRRATLDDAPALAALGASAFAASFAHSCSADDLAAYLASTYSPAHQRAELVDPATRVLVADDGDGTELAGYAMLHEGPAPPCVAGPRPIELARLYARAGATGRGVGARLIDACKADARGRGFGTLWLGVWEHNHGARRFYERHGLLDVGAHLFMIGADAQTDRLMACPL